MHFPKLTPLQSRFAASLLASALLIYLYLTLTSPSFAYAAEVDSIISPDHNHPIIFDADDLHTDFYEDEMFDDVYEPEFSLFDRSIIGRAPPGVTALANNAAQQMNINAGFTQVWVFPKLALAGNLSAATPGLPSIVERRDGDAVGLFERQEQGAGDADDVEIPGGSRTLFITMNVCLQPTSNSSEGPIIPPQLQLYVARSSRLENPGPDAPNDEQTQVTVLGGFATYTLEASDDVYIGVTAPNVTTFSGIWNYELAASIDAPFHGLDPATNLYFVDSDNQGALLVTNDTTQADGNSTIYQEWMDLQPPFSLFAHNQNDTAILGVQNSYCGLKHRAQIFATYGDNVAGEVGMTNRGLGSKPKEQFYIRGLNASSTYYGFLAMNGNSTASGNGIVGGGGKVWQAMNFTTKQEDNCALIFNLPFCSEVAYAVPSSPNQTVDSLISLYDTYASTYYTYFNYSLQQIPCNTTNTAQWSLARNCDDCAAAYKTWLCAVTIPRCEDYSSSLSYLLPRNTAQSFPNGSTLTPAQLSSETLPEFVLDSISNQEIFTPNLSTTLLTTVTTNSSRNPIIDTQIRPGPYKEVLPCKDLCYDLVQSCPAALGFTCPLPGRGLEISYGKRSADGDVTCSYLGAAYYLSGSPKSLLSSSIFSSENHGFMFLWAFMSIAIAWGLW